MSVYRDPNPEKQVMLSKRQPSARTPRSTPATPDATIATRFHETFQELLSSSKHAATTGSDFFAESQEPSIKV
jgi:hypothetical protein